MMSRNIKKPGMNKWQWLLVEFPLMLLMCSSIVYLFVSALDLRLSVIAVVGINFVCLGVYTAAFANKRTLIISSVIFLLAASAASYLFFARDSSGDVTEFQGSIDSFLYWAASYLKGHRTENLPYMEALIITLSIIISLSVSFFTVRKLDLIAVVLPGAACFIVLFIIGHTINMPCLFCFILSATLYFLLHSYKRNTAEMSAGEAPPPVLFMASALPLALLVLTITILASNLVKLDPDWMKDIRDKILNKENKVNDYIPSSINTPIVSKSELGGNISLSNTVVMEVTSPDSSVYLRGISKDVYTGHSWEQSDTKTATFYPDFDQFEDTAYTLNTFAHIEDETYVINNLLQPNMIKIKYKEISTGIIYLPLKTYDINGINSGQYINLVGNDTLMLIKGNAQDGFEYNIDFYRINSESPLFSEIIQFNSLGQYSATGTLSNHQFYTQNGENVTAFIQENFGMSIQYTIKINEQYTKLTAVSSGQSQATCT